ncbi:MAG: LPS export ABC transporter periplasmic protein LptC [Rhodospirillales bacterium]|nr:LPS export ABC transporter periplasmic protein LptC [Rhodospirillales bacterium]
MNDTPRRTVVIEEETPERPRRWRRRFNGDTTAARHSAVGYSRFVTLMKVTLPLVALTLIGLVLAWPRPVVDDSRFRIGFSILKASEAENPSMVNARYQGLDDQSQVYAITADMARDMLKGSAAIELDMPKADLALKDGSWLVLTAETGVYVRERRSLVLKGSVNLFHDTGYEIRTSEADIDLASSFAQGSVPVEGHGPFGEVKAQGFRLEDKGKLITFSGKSRLILYPDAGRGRP